MTPASLIHANPTIENEDDRTLAARKIRTAAHLAGSRSILRWTQVRKYTLCALHLAGCPCTDQSLTKPTKNGVGSISSWEE